MERELKRVKNGSSISSGQRGNARPRHHGHGKFYKQQLHEFLQVAPKRTM